MIEENSTKKLLRDSLLYLTLASLAGSIVFIFVNLMQIPSEHVNFLIAAPVVVFLLPYLFLSLFEIKKIDAKMSVIPRFFRDVVDSVESGTDLISSIQNSVKNEYGALNEDIKKLANQLSWGVDFEKAIVNFANNVGSKDLLRDLLLVIEARRVGGHVEKILRELSEKITTETLRIKERKNNLASNTFTGYISFFIFLLIVILVYNNLFLELGASMDGDGETSEEQDLALNLYLTLFTLLSYELAILSGFLFGMMQENKLISGAPHVVVLVVATFIGFFFFI